MTILKVFLLSLVLLLAHQAIPQQEDQSWETVFEKSGFISTADYEETMNYFQSFADNSEFAEFHSFGISPQGRELKYLVVSKDKLFTSEELKAANKPLLLVINGIHSGEIEGKDASMILLREILITKEKEYLLDSMNIIVVPIFSVDGHERKSKYNRINQNGPEEMGWRTTAQNLNLNRDWMKADAPEMQAMLKLFNRYIPDFIIDTHTTNGADYQYTVTYSVEWSKNMYHQTADWLGEKFVPFIENKVDETRIL
jgi:murein tripeptide amidase MpaA